MIWIWHNWLYIDLEKSPHLCSSFELSSVAECHLCLRSWGVLTAWWICPLKLFLRTFASKDPANLTVLSLQSQEWLLSESHSFFQKVRPVPRRRGSNTSNRSEVSANVAFLAKLSNKEIYWKIAVRLGLIKSNYPIMDVPTPLNCCKVSLGNS
jgi:hypothetical protein